jgi:hypothetical protein
MNSLVPGRKNMDTANARPGSKIVFSNPTFGYESDQKLAKECLRVGETYTIKSIQIHRWNTDVYLDEVPDEVFNSVLFENA